MARASTVTLLSLDRYAKILGLSPVHFNGAAGGAIWPATGSCTMIWPQYAWQTDEMIISREELAESIYEAEQDIKRVLGYSPALTWEENERHPYIKDFDSSNYIHGIYGADNRLRITNARYGEINAAGRRAVALIDTPSVTYTDDDGDGYKETATIACNTTLTDVRELKVYFEGYYGDQEWEVRDVRSKSIASGVLTVVVDSWQLINPTLWEAHPSSNGFQAIAIETAGNYVVEVDVYREYNDMTQAGATLYWENAFCNSSACVGCTQASHDGCFRIKDAHLGVVVPLPATYNALTSAWDVTQVSACNAPSEVALWYRAGKIDKAYERSKTYDPLGQYWATTIAWLATARLAKPLCGCGNVQAVANDLRTDLARNSREANYTVDLNVLSNPFGTRNGEIRAWKRVAHLANEQIMDSGAF